ncbi:MAG: amidohydrolase [Dehalococcoidia bacterium]
MNKTEAALILFNANVITMDPALPRARMVAVGEGRIIGVGNNEDRDDFRGERTKVIDCRGRTVIPGFHDAHLHIFSMISSLISLDCSPAAVSSIVDIQRLIAEKAMQVPAGTWIKGSEYDKFYLEEGRHPTRWDLDKAAPAHPVKLAHRTRYACVLNSRGLALAGITAETPDPPGCLIEREAETGEPTGLLFGMNTYLGKRVIPPPPEEEFSEGLSRANHILLENGITSLQDATVHNELAQWEELKRIKNTGLFLPRVTVMFGFDSLEDFIKIRESSDENLSLGPMKLVVDEISGALNPPQQTLNERILSAHRAGFQVAIHGIQDTTVHAALTALEYALAELPREGHRHRIEHCSECPDYLLQRLKEAGAMVVTQPAFLYYNGEKYFAEVEEAKLPWLYRMGSWWRNGIPVAAGSDAPVNDLNPLIGIYAAVTRRSPNGSIISPEETIDPEQALWMYTMGGAYAAFQDDVKGSITAGKLADLAVLSADPTSVADEEINDITVEKTVIGGEVVWEKG